MDPIYISRRRNQKNNRLRRLLDRHQQQQKQQQPKQEQQQQQSAPYQLMIEHPTCTDAFNLIIISQSPMTMSVYSRLTGLVLPMVAANSVVVPACPSSSPSPSFSSSSSSSSVSNRPILPRPAPFSRPPFLSVRYSHQPTIKQEPQDCSNNCPFLIDNIK